MTTLLEYGKNIVEAVTGGRLKEAFANIDGAYKLKSDLTTRIYGEAGEVKRGRPLGAKSPSADETSMLPEALRIIAAHGPMTLAAVHEAKGGDQSSLARARLKRELNKYVTCGSLREESGKYSSTGIAPTAPARPSRKPKVTAAEETTQPQEVAA